MSTAVALASLSDADLIARVVAGSREDFEVLVRRHNQRLFRAARAIVKADDEAEDVVQQTWLEVFRHLPQFRGDAQFTTWATRICVNAALAHVRKRPVVAEVTDEVASDAAPDDTVDREQLGRLLEACLQRLPQGNREVMVLRDVLELDTAETAELLHLSEEAVRVRLHRARAAVAADLTERMIDKVYSFDGARCDRLTGNVMRQVLLQGA
ncbi:MAG TPA: sigma-70 family RNA polymerase sigma factor [Kofleriaceae bacterium]|jgi:RNA polymerase sigma-70 factor (ECF subfamily)|nr:sigma-70 family RNA polymerase sigma factor [Kofleriaceae bacterium]